MRIVSFLLVIVAQAWGLRADDNSARRYVCTQTDPILCKYFLLSTKQVQAHLKLTEVQIKSLESKMLGSTDSIPGIMELRRSREQKLKAALSDEERLQIRRAGNEKATSLIYEDWVAGLQSTLTPTQAISLNALLLQMKGPLVILEDTNLFQRLGLSKDQIGGLKDISEQYAQLLSLLRHRYLGLQINPIRRDRSEVDVNSEMRCLIREIKDVEMDQDSELLHELNPEQRRLWKGLCGPPVSIDWKEGWFTDVPFGSGKAK